MPLAYSDKNPILVIDPGHGGTDPGGGGNKDFKEKDKVLSMSLYMLNRCRELKIPVGITRTTDKLVAPLDRAKMIRESKAKYCISNHTNSASDKNARGCETIHSIHSDGVFAKLIYENLQDHIPGRRVFTRAQESDKTKDYYYIHRLTGNVTCVIVEYGFASNVEDAKILSAKEKDLVESVLRALCTLEGYLYDKVPNSSPSPEIFPNNDIFKGYIDTLFDKQIISDKNYWMENAITGKTCKGEYVHQLISNMVTKGLGIVPEKPRFIHELVDDCHIIKIKPLDLNIELGNVPISSMKHLKNAVNGSFFWYEDAAKTKTYANCILVSKGKIIGNRATHADKKDRSCRQSVLVIRNTGIVDMFKVKDVNEIPDLRSIHLAIGGLGLVTPDGYSPITEGFYYPYDDVLRNANKTFLGYVKSEDMIYIMVSPNSPHSALISLCERFKLDMAISLDGGGSTSLKIDDKIIYYGDGRKINHYLTW